MMAVSVVLLKNNKRLMLAQHKLNKYLVSESLTSILKSETEDEQLKIVDTFVSDKKDDASFSVSPEMTLEDVLEFDRNFKYVTFTVQR